jgi:hypothetical protein
MVARSTKNRARLLSTKFRPRYFVPSATPLENRIDHIVAGADLSTATHMSSILRQIFTIDVPHRMATGVSRSADEQTARWIVRTLSLNAAARCRISK